MPVSLLLKIIKFVYLFCRIRAKQYLVCYKPLRYFQDHNIILFVKRNKIVVFSNSPGLVFGIIDTSQ